jgi:hypothetical protein
LELTTTTTTTLSLIISASLIPEPTCTGSMHYRARLTRSWMSWLTGTDVHTHPYPLSPIHTHIHPISRRPLNPSWLWLWLWLEHHPSRRINRVLVDLSGVDLSV